MRLDRVNAFQPLAYQGEARGGCEILRCFEWIAFGFIGAALCTGSVLSIQYREADGAFVGGRRELSRAFRHWFCRMSSTRQG